MLGHSIGLVPGGTELPPKSARSLPFTDRFEIDRQRLQEVMQPFQWLVRINLALIVMGIGLTTLVEMAVLFHVIITVVGVGMLFFMGGMMTLFPVYTRDKELQLELDHEGGFIQLKRPGENLLFHRQQVLVCEWHQPLLMPYQVDQISLHLKGGKTLELSSLVIEPTQLIAWLQSGYVTRHPWVKVR